MAKHWYDYPITNPHSSDDGIDLGDPDNTPLAFPEGGQVIDASYHVYGGQVVVHTPEGWDEYFIHANKIYAQRGEHVDPEQVVATSGGGVGDLILKQGKVQPATSQSDYQGHSSGYHSEFGEFRDTSQFGDMAQFNEGWGNKARQLDPTSIIAALRLEHPPVGTPPSDTGLAGSNQSALQGASADWKDPNTWGPAIMNGIASSLGFSSPGNMAARLTAYAAGLALIGVGAITVVQPEASNVVSQALKAVK